MPKGVLVNNFTQADSPLQNADKRKTQLVIKHVMRRSRSMSGFRNEVVEVPICEKRVLKLQNGLELEVEMISGGEPNSMRIIKIRGPKDKTSKKS